MNDQLAIHSSVLHRQSNTTTERLAVYTTIYPGVEPYLADWHRSVVAQTDQGFDLWIGVDQLTVDQVCAACGEPVTATWVRASDGASPAQIRGAALEQIVQRYAGVVLVDSDDLLYPFRVAVARAALQTGDAYACALNVIDQAGRDMGIVFAPPLGEQAERLLPRHNVWGFSNTAYRTALLQQCLPFPAECVLIDWLLATRAWVSGARMLFDHTPHMAYRQYHANVARVLPPFTAAQVQQATARVLNHYGCVLSVEWPLPKLSHHAIAKAYGQAQRFAQACRQPETLQQYVEALNRMEPQYVWWWCVAHPALEELWNT